MAATSLNRHRCSQASTVLACLAVTWSCAAAESEVLLFDFESQQQTFENADKLALVADHATQGKFAGKVMLDQPFDMNIGFWGGTNKPGTWGEYDQFVVDVFVDGGGASAVGFATDKDGKDWFKRYNYEFKLPPGKRKIAFSLGALNRSNNNGNLDLKTMDFLALRLQSDDPKNPATVYLDNGRLVKGSGSFEVKALYSFEGQDTGKILLEDYPDEFKGKSAMSVVEEHAINGKKALKLESHAPAGNVQFTGFESDWSTYDSLLIDIANPTKAAIKVGGWIKGGGDKSDYWNRHNWERVLKPGFNSVRIAIGSMSFPDGHNGNLDPKNVSAFNLSCDQQTLFFDNIRLVKGVEEVAVQGLRRFDFGPTNSATMPGFAKATSKSAYDKGQGWGWLPGGTFGRDFDMNEMLGRHRAPDDLCRDFSMPITASFAVDLPNGTYGVWLMMGPPANGWGPSFVHRSVRANGKVVVDEKYDLESFKKHEYAFQDSEDLPGDDLWTTYIDVLFKPTLFDSEVTDGQLRLDFDSYGAWWSCMVNGVVIYPKSQQKEADSWLANFNQTRKEQFESMHVQKLPEPKNAAAAKPNDQDQKRGYLTFVASPEKDIFVNSQPTAAEAANHVLDIAAAPGEFEDICLGLFPLKECGNLKLTVGELSGPGKIPASAISIQVARYKALNQTAEYMPLAKYLDVVPADGIAVSVGVTRAFWIVAHVPEKTAPGAYTGTIQLAWANGTSDSVDLRLTVYPIQLAEADFPMGMFCVGPVQSYLSFDPTGEAHWSAWKEILADARAHGQTTLDPQIAIPLKSISAGKADIDFTQGDRFMKLAKEAGFSKELFGYSLNTGFAMRIGGIDKDAEAKRFGVASYGDLAKAYFDGYREHAKKNEWLPMCFCTDDEYIVHPDSDPAKLALLHRTLQQSAPDMHFIAFDSALYGKITPEIEAAQMKMLADIDTWGAGIHSPREAEIARANKHRLWLYNTGMNRFTFGTYMGFAREKYGVTGFGQWVYPNIGTYGSFYLASHNEAHYGVVYPSTHGLRSTPTWERVRAGCDDHRYIQTAWNLLKRAKAENKGGAEAKALDATLEKTFKLLRFGNDRVDAANGEGKADNPMAPEAMETFKRSLATGIIALQNALDKK
ncbi:MAG: hypothetical protein H0W83_06085 [Planctomycetes bacterium]|nr:hypothetical protein [Planctomycetota bacterium]